MKGGIVWRALRSRSRRWNPRDTLDISPINDDVDGKLQGFYRMQAKRLAEAMTEIEALEQEHLRWLAAAAEHNAARNFVAATE